MSLTSYRAAPPRAKTYENRPRPDREIPQKTNGGIPKGKPPLSKNVKRILPFAGLATTYSPRS
jgi:hypothetical protein